ncbi:Tetratricopeptide-like helical domain superfamily [Sesbania bispinosa]|nr:Tetratricopeptide-like helical domain superfamily [Sesbania bispinosa]
MKAKHSIEELFSIPGLDDEKCGAWKKDNNRLETSVMDGGMGSNGSGRGSDGGHGSGWDFPEGNNYGRDRTDAYYQNMIEANPGDALLLGNYAKFLKEVCEDYSKAEEYLERAILANPGDAHILSLYADLIWQTEKNADRAEGYFDQAIKSAPDDW